MICFPCPEGATPDSHIPRLAEVVNLRMAMSGIYQGMPPLLSDTVVLYPLSGELQRTPDSQTYVKSVVEASRPKLLVYPILHYCGRPNGQDLCVDRFSTPQSSREC